jgi:hypothetical protein
MQTEYLQMRQYRSILPIFLDLHSLPPFAWQGRRREQWKVLDGEWAAFGIDEACTIQKVHDNTGCDFKPKFE